LANTGIQRKRQNKGKRAPHSYYIANGGWPYRREIRLGAECELDRQVAALGGILNKLEQRIHSTGLHRRYQPHPKAWLPCHFSSIPETSRGSRGWPALKSLVADVSPPIGISPSLMRRDQSGAEDCQAVRFWAESISSELPQLSKR
jgi:hypothetical protein